MMSVCVDDDDDASQQDADEVIRLSAAFSLLPSVSLCFLLTDLHLAHGQTTAITTAAMPHCACCVLPFFRLPSKFACSEQVRTKKATQPRPTISYCRSKWDTPIAAPPCLSRPEPKMLLARRRHSVLTRRKMMTRTRFHCKARWRPRADSTAQMRCRGR